MKFTTERPTKEGWYWAKTITYNTHHTLDMVQIYYLKNIGLVISSHEIDNPLPDPFFTHFAGPIPEPEE